MEKQAILNLAVAVLLVMNVLSFSLMGADKRRARQGKWRIRERTLLTVFALYAPVKVQNMILGGGILRSGGNTRLIMTIDILGTWLVGIPLCLFAAYVLHWGIVGVYALLTGEELFRLAVSLAVFKKKTWMVSLA